MSQATAHEPLQLSSDDENEGDAPPQSGLTESRLLKTVLDSLSDGILISNCEGNISYFNRKIVELMDIPEGILLTAPQQDVLNHLVKSLPFVNQKNCDDQRPMESREILGLSDGRLCEMHCIPLFENGKASGFIWRFRDITEIKDTDEGLHWLRLMDDEFNHPQDVDSALEILVNQLGVIGQWALGQSWTPDGHGFLRCHSATYVKQKGLNRFRSLSKNFQMPMGFGLPGRVWKTAAAAWIGDVSLDRNFPRAPVAHDVGLVTAVGLPLIVGKEVAAVLEFFGPAKEYDSESWYFLSPSQIKWEFTWRTAESAIEFLTTKGK